MLIIETSIFTRQVAALLSDEEYRKLQMELVSSKSEMDDLTPNQLKVLKKIIEKEYR